MGTVSQHIYKDVQSLYLTSVVSYRYAIWWSQPEVPNGLWGTEGTSCRRPDGQRNGNVSLFLDELSVMSLLCTPPFFCWRDSQLIFLHQGQLAKHDGKLWMTCAPSCFRVACWLLYWQMCCLPDFFSMVSQAPSVTSNWLLLLFS